MRLQAVHPWGLLASRGVGRARFGRSPVSLVVAGPGAFSPASPPPVPIRRADDGTATSARLVTSVHGASTAAAVGSAIEATLTVQGDLCPGTYDSELLILDESGAVATRTPVILTVRAHWVWPVAFLLLGLLTVGILAFLAGEGQLRDERARVLAERRAFDEMVDRSLARELDPVAVQETEEAFGDAFRFLDESRPLSLRDDRIERAGRRQAAAREGAAGLRKRYGGSDPAAMGAEAVAADWSALSQRMDAALALRDQAPGSWVGDGELGDGLERFLDSRWRLDVGNTVTSIEATLRPEVERVARAASASELARAQRSAVATRRLMRRAARQLDQAVENYWVFSRLASDTSISAGYVAAIADRPEVDPAGRSRLRAALAGARLSLAEPTPERFRLAHQQIQEATTAAYAFENEILIQRIQAAFDAADARTSRARIDAYVESLAPDPSPEGKIAAIGGALELWRERIQVVEDPSRREQLAGLITRIGEQAQAESWEAALGGLGELSDAWLEYQEEQTRAAQASVLLPYCRNWKASLSLQLVGAGEQLAVLQDDPEMATADREIEGLRQQIATVREDADCHSALTNVSGRFLKLQNRLFVAGFRRIPAPTEDLLAAAHSSGVRAAVPEAKRLLLPVRPLDVSVVTPPAKRLGGRRIGVEVRNLDPVWGAGSEVRVDFGDGSAAWVGDAETLRQQPVLKHRYRAPGRYRVSVRVSGQPVDAADAATASQLLGDGAAAIEIAADPIVAARRLGSLFFNLRFLLALAIGLLIQGWRVAGDRPFGGARRDYLEAFAVGFVAHAGIDGLVALVPKLL